MSQPIPSLTELRFRWVQLAHSFPVLHNHAPGLYAGDVDVKLLDAWAARDLEDAATHGACMAEGKTPMPGDGAVEAARFMLGVYDRLRDWKCGRFDVFRALGVWDAGQLAAFKAWAANPWCL